MTLKYPMRSELSLEELIKNERERSFGFTSAMFDLHYRELNTLLDAAERSIKLEAENKILKEALEKYADSQNWMHENGDNIFKVDAPIKYGVTVRYLEYELARDVLEKLK